MCKDVSSGHKVELLGYVVGAFGLPSARGDTKSAGISWKLLFLGERCGGVGLTSTSRREIADPPAKEDTAEQPNLGPDRFC